MARRMAGAQSAWRAGPVAPARTTVIRDGRALGQADGAGHGRLGGVEGIAAEAAAGDGGGGKGRA